METIGPKLIDEIEKIVDDAVEEAMNGYRYDEATVLYIALERIKELCNKC